MDYSFLSSSKNILEVITKGANDLGSLHPIVVHIPIALLLVSPLFIIIDLIFKKFSREFYFCSLALLAIGTLGIICSIVTGNAAGESIEPTSEILKTLDAHVRLAERIRLGFFLLTSTLTTYIVFMKTLLKKYHLKIHQIVIILYLLAYAYHLVLLFNTAHQGGKLVHHHGITSSLYDHKTSKNTKTPDNLFP